MSSQALLSIAARRRDVGRLAGRQARSIPVDGTKPGDLSVLPVDRYAHVMNMTAARKRGLYRSVEILQVAGIVH